MALLLDLLVAGQTRLNDDTYAKNIYADKFIRTGSSDLYVLLGGGGHKLLSDFSMAHEHPYLSLSGGTMTGALTVTQYIFGYNYNHAGGNAPAFLFDKPGSCYTGIGANGETDTIYFSAATITDGEASWVTSYKQKWKFNGTIYQENNAVIHAGNIGSQSVSYATSAGNADTVDSQHFSYSNDSNSPTYLWATNSNGSSFLAARGSISVNYANSAGTATTLYTNNTAQDASLCYNESPGLHFYRFNGTGNDIGGGDGFILQWSWNPGSVGGQIYLDDNPSKIAAIRGYDSSSTTFTSWSKFIHSTNYTDYVNTTNFPGLNKVGTVTSVTVTGANGLSGTGTITSSGTITLSNAGVRSTTINGNYLRVNTNGTNTDLTIPYATNSDTVDGYHFSDLESRYVNVTGDTMSGRLNIGVESSGNANPLCLYHSNIEVTAVKGKSVGIRLGHEANSYYARIAAIFESQNPDYLRPGLAFYTMDSTYQENTESERMRISAAGNVGIGTSSPSYKLDVNGTLNATRILVNSATYGSDSLTVGGCIRITGGTGSGHAAGLRRVYFGDGNHCCLGEGGSGEDTDWMYIMGTKKILLECNKGSTTIDINGYPNSPGFIKAGSDNNYVLLGGGGHKALSDFSMAHSHPYLPLAGGTMTGAINLSSTNAKLAFGSLTTSPITGYKAPSLLSNGVGIYSRYGGSSDEGAIIITEDTCVIYNSADTGWNFQIMDKDLGTDMTNDATRSFGVNSEHQAWSLSGFVKSGSSDSYVLLGGGGHKAISDFATAGHTHSYLPLSGGTCTGNIYAPAFYESSDERLKDFYNSIDVDLDKLSSLPKKFFKWKSNPNGEFEIGTSAQELQKIYPQLVNTDDKGYLTVAYDKLSIIALRAIDKLYEMNKNLERRIQILESKL